MYEIMKAIHDMISAAVGILFCWIPLAMGTYDAVRGDRGTFAECVQRDWGLWWSVYEAKRSYWKTGN